MGHEGAVFEGKTLDDAVRKGLEALGLSRAEAMITMIDEGSGGFLGIGARPYRVRIMPRPGGPIPEPVERGERDRGRREQGRGGRGGSGGRPARGGRRDEGYATRGGRGERGDRGDQGERGDRGPRGDRGDRRRPGEPNGGRGRHRDEVQARGPRESSTAESPRGERGPREVYGGDSGRGERGPREVHGGEPGRGDRGPREVHGGEPGRGDRDRDRGRRRRRGRSGRPGDGRAFEGASESRATERRERDPEIRERSRDDAPGRGSEFAPAVGRENHREAPAEMRDRDGAVASAVAPPPPAELAAEGQRLTEELLRHMSFDATVTARAEDTRVDVMVEVKEGEELLTGRRGEVRQALQHLLNLMLNRGGRGLHLQLEVNDFWQRRETELQEMARGLADDALASGGEAVSEYLNAQERRVVHVTLRDDTRVKTYALGTGLIKRVAVAPADYPSDAESDG